MLRQHTTLLGLGVRGSVMRTLNVTSKSHYLEPTASVGNNTWRQPLAEPNRAGQGSALAVRLHTYRHSCASSTHRRGRAGDSATVLSQNSYALLVPRAVINAASSSMPCQCLCPVLTRKVIIRGVEVKNARLRTIWVAASADEEAWYSTGYIPSVRPTKLPCPAA